MTQDRPGEAGGGAAAEWLRHPEGGAAPAAPGAGPQTRAHQARQRQPRDRVLGQHQGEQGELEGGRNDSYLAQILFAYLPSQHKQGQLWSGLDTFFLCPLSLMESEI